MAKVEPTSDQTTATTLPERDLNSTGAFAEVSPSAQVTGAATLTNVFPDDASQFQDNITALDAEHDAKVADLHSKYGYGTDFSDTSKSTKEIMDQVGPGHTEESLMHTEEAIMTPELSTAAYATVEADLETEGSGGEEEESYLGYDEEEIDDSESSGSSS